MHRDARSAAALALTVATFLLFPAAAGADSPILSHDGKTEAQSIAIAGGTAASNTERFDIPSDEGAFTFDEAPAPPAASRSGDRGSANATAGAVFHASASAGADGTIAISASGAAQVSASVHDNDPGVDDSSHFAEGTASAKAQIRFEVRGEPAPFRISGSASGSTFAELRNSQDIIIVRIEPGQPALGVTGTLQPGVYELEFDLDIEEEAQAPGSHSGDDDANGDVALQVGAADADGDALPDDWETNGVDTDGDGSVDLDLPGMGARPRHKDVFVELDFMSPHRFDAGGVSPVIDAFADAPVGNPDGTSGITLHIDNGAGSVMNPVTGATWGSRSRQSQIPHQNVLGSLAGSNYVWSDFDALKATHFPAERRTAFHYAISGHGHDGTASGIARGAPSAELLLTLGAGCQQLTGSDCTMDASAQAGTLMHELGHNLGLRHGGGDDLEYKPNYLSVMNYAFQLGGLKATDGTSFLDYSRFGIELNEAALNEAQGLGVTSGPATDLLTLIRCPNGSRIDRPVAVGPVDFDCDGTPSGTVASDVTGDGAKTVLPGFIDWPALVFAGGAIGGAGAAPPAQTVADEPPLAELIATRDALEAAVAPANRPSPGGNPAGSNGTGAAAPGVTATPATTPFAVTALRLRPERFRAARRGGSIAPRGGARLSYTLSRAARVRFTVERLLPGHRRAGRCRPSGQGRRCTRPLRVRGSFSDAGTAGANRVRFTGRIARHALRRGAYRITATPTADGARGTARHVDFTIR